MDIVVGDGGKGVRQADGPSNGGNSYMSNSISRVIVAYGGGYGGGEGNVATAGGSGGGGSHGRSLTPGRGIADPPPRQGYDGGDGSNCDAGGGGGAGGAGKTPAEGRAGGPGKSSILRDGITPVIYASGGNGHGRDGVEGVSKAANTGDGGDGAGVSGGGTGGNGGSGIVIVRYIAFAVANRPVTDVTASSANLNGWLDGTGGEPVSVCVLWGEKNGGDTWDWAKTEWFDGGKGSDNTPYTKKIAGLAGNKNYY